MTQAVAVEFQHIAKGVYAHVGDTSALTVDNEGLNANIGLVVTPAGVELMPGHGSITTLTAAQADTQVYLLAHCARR